MGLKVTLYSSKSHYHSYRGHVGKTAPNYLHQQFNARKAYQVLHTDITQISISENVKGYLSPVIDEASGAVVAYATSTHPNMNLITTMLVSLFKKLPQGSSPIIKAGNINSGSIEVYYVNMELLSRCPVREIAWIIHR